MSRQKFMLNIHANQLIELIYIKLLILNTKKIDRRELNI